MLMGGFTKAPSPPVDTALPIKPHHFVESGVVCGPVCRFPAQGGRQGEAQGGRSIEVFIDLEAIAYVKGGVPMDPASIGFGNIQMMDMLGTTDPFCEKIVPCGVQVVLCTDDPCRPLFQIFNESGEVDAGWSKPGGCMWVRFYGC